MCKCAHVWACMHVCEHVRVLARMHVCVLSTIYPLQRWKTKVFSRILRSLAVVNFKWDVILRQDNVKVYHLNYSEPSWRPGTARQLHLWIHLKDTSSIGSKQLACALVIVNCKWDVILRYDNVKVCHVNYSEPSWRPATAHQLLLWRHLKDLSSKGGRQLAPELAILNWEWDII